MNRKVKIVLNDEQEAALLEQLRAIPGTQYVIAALVLSRREPDLYRLTWPNAPASNWRDMPVKKLKQSHGRPTLEYAYVCK